MTDNMDEFEQEQFDSGEEPGERARPGVKQSFAEAWRNKPIFKLLVIMAVVAFAMAGALGAFSSAPEQAAAKLGKTPNIKEVPGGKSSPFFIEQNKQANEQRVDQALAQGGSAIPTPVGNDIDLSELTEKTKKDPLLEFRAETERLKQELRAEQKQNTQQVQVLQQQIKQKPVQEDETLARAMQKQMQELMKSWSPGRMVSVNGVTTKEETQAAAAAKASSMQLASLEQNAAEQAAAQKPVKALIPAGTVNYAQLLTEANSDVPGPILAQILSGPLAGGRAIGQFQVMNEYLVLTFSRVSFKGKDYSINALALDPDTTLGGMATEVDHRYLTRLLLPAAASFMSAFGDALSDGSSETTISGDTVIVSEASKGSKDAMYSGLGQMGQTMSEFMKNEANNTKVLVRVAVGTPMGLFFTQPVTESGTGSMPDNQSATQTLQQLLAAERAKNAASQQETTNMNTLYSTGTGTSSNSGMRVLSPGSSYKAGTTTIYTR